VDEPEQFQAIVTWMLAMMAATLVMGDRINLMNLLATAEQPDLLIEAPAVMAAMTDLLSAMSLMSKQKLTVMMTGELDALNYYL